MDILDELRHHENLSVVPEPQLQWLIDSSELVELEDGEYLYRNGTPIDHLWLILKGRLRMFVAQAEGRQTRELGYNEKGYIGGVLPYSRLKTAVANAVAVESTTVLRLHRNKFKEMIQTQDELVQPLVHLMLDRIRDFTKLDQQNEKMISLGKLSAGLAHELNNPAAAVVRSASALKRHLGFEASKFKQVMTIHVSEEQVDKVSELLAQKLQEGPQGTLSLMEKSAREDDLTDWLDDREVENSCEVAESFAEYNITTDDLDQVEEHVSDKYLSPVLNWLNNVLTTEKMVNEIAEASGRIGNLVKSIKEYSHMDGGGDKKKIVLRDGVESTLRILQHKTKSKHIEVAVEMPDHLPLISVSPGEINQVWTNLIDNALDALPEGGKIRIEAEQDRNFIVTRIIDDGAGIPENVINRIFDPFFTTKEVGKGTGLGLEIAQNIVKRHRGQISVKSQPGRTEFSVCLPLDE
ncbi:ATP-binding protein [Rhabdobacter roseus]|uniref:histidine kinase n=1 Tax=Rhabdobacter roseus TaxID=1655419 RepID=A0A840TDQ5_9BACT|nr:ATP-binding protein [Rhabdobacter roseus]MBB5282246.1 signal transduction histidine kinase [Rhabdobacter roseus]